MNNPFQQLSAADGLPPELRDIADKLAGMTDAEMRECVNIALCLLNDPANAAMAGGMLASHMRRCDDMARGYIQRGEFGKARLWQQLKDYVPWQQDRSAEPAINGHGPALIPEVRNLHDTGTEVRAAVAANLKGCISDARARMDSWPVRRRSSEIQDLADTMRSVINAVEVIAVHFEALPTEGGAHG